MESSKLLRRRLALTALAVLAALLSVTAATFAWYVYNTSARTTQVKMAAGSSVSLQIASSPEGPYSSSAVMQSFTGLLEPVSTNSIGGGFQKAITFVSQGEGESTRLVANRFLPGAETVDYYKTSLYLKTTAPQLDIYLSDIQFEDANPQNPISTAMRLGIVAEGRETIFELTGDHNPNADDNAAREPGGGYVLDSSRDDGSTLAFTPLNRSNFCSYNPEDGTVTVPDSAVKLCTITSDGSGEYGEAVKLDIYLWLEGCDEDCTLNLASQTLTSLALAFGGYTGTEG